MENAKQIVNVYYTINGNSGVIITGNNNTGNTFAIDQRIKTIQEIAENLLFNGDFTPAEKVKFLTFLRDSEKKYLQ